MSFHYRVDATNTTEHLINIEFRFVSPYDMPVLEMPVWTPGSYKVRDYSKHVHNVSVTSSGHEVVWQKISKHQWLLHVGEGQSIQFNYQVYAFELTVRTSYLDDRYGLLSPASLFFYLTNMNGNNTKSEKITVQLRVTDNWMIFTSLPESDGVYLASDFDELVDSPFGLAHENYVETGKYSITNPDNTKIPCTVALIGKRGNHDLAEFINAMKKLQAKSIEMFGSLPYDRYFWVFYVVGSGSGGLEHKYSNFSIINRWYFNDDHDMNYARMLSLQSHEHFHAYNIKRIRPKQLGPFDYSKEVYTNLLWVAEGMTSYYDNIFLPRTELISDETYWKVISKDYSKLQTIPGRSQISLMESSFDVWITRYQPYDGITNFYVSYYLKGSLVAFMLDLEIRNQTHWEKSLDDFFLSMYQQYLSTKEGYQEDNIQTLIEDSTGTDLNKFWDKYVKGVERLDFDYYLNFIGMKLSPKKESDDRLPFVGWRLSESEKKVAWVELNSPASRAGISNNDKLVAIDNFEVTKKNYNSILLNHNPGDQISVHVIRDGELRKIPIILSEPKTTEFEIIGVEDPNQDQIHRYKAFLHKKHSTNKKMVPRTKIKPNSRNQDF